MVKQSLVLSAFGLASILAYSPKYNENYDSNYAKEVVYENVEYQPKNMYYDMNARR
ncbi:hypothetical protein AX774_g7281, partial [Zancudomyces culisetae]